MSVSAPPDPVPVPNTVIFTAQELTQIAALSLNQRLPPQDPSNQYATNEIAAKLGKNLFFDLRLSSDKQVSCATCHNPRQGWSTTDALITLRGVTLTRHSPSLWNVAYNRWFFWDGRADSLWAQALQSLENEAELMGDRTHAVRLILTDPSLASDYRLVFGELPTGLSLETLPLRAKPRPKGKTLVTVDESIYQAWEQLPASTQFAINRVVANLMKAIAAFEMTIQSDPTTFDQFATQLSIDQGIVTAANSAISPNAQQGLKLFLGRGRCINCHFGVNFTDGEFHRIFFESRAKTQDTGRFAGVRELLADPFNTAGLYADGVGTYRNRLDYLQTLGLASFWASFKTPSLRNIEASAPYMHDGRFSTLSDVINHYNTVQPKGHHQQQLLTTLDLSKQEQQFLVEFLQTLSSPTP